MFTSQDSAKLFANIMTLLVSCFVQYNKTALFYVDKNCDFSLL
jgi:hypothetical protein